MKKLKLPPLSRGWKIVRNFGVALLILLFVWGLTDFYIHNPVLSFHRAEQANWVGPSEIQSSFRTDRDLWVVGTCSDQVLFHREDSRGFEYWPRQEDGPTIVPAPGHIAVEDTVWVVAVDVPEEAVSARLELTTACYYSEEVRRDGYSRQYSAEPEPSGGVWKYGEPRRWEKSYTAQGEFLDEGGVLFRVVSGDRDIGSLEQYILSAAYDWDTYTRPRSVRSMDCSMTAVFYDEAGQEVARAELKAPV